jgi:hypothetical protein
MAMPDAVVRKSLERATLQYAASLEVAEEYLRLRGIGMEDARSVGLGVVVEPIPGHEHLRGRLAIPYLTDYGPVNMNFRCIQDHKCKDHGHQKYMMWKGLETNLYNVQVMRHASDWIALSEGEIDALSATISGIPTLGVPGALKWLDHWNNLLEDFTRIYVFEEGDEAGKKFADKIVTEVNAIRVVLPAGKDVNSVMISEGPEALRRRIRK